MIAYHGTPLGGPHSERSRFYRSRHALVPYGDQQDLGAVAEFSASFVVDSSAFSAWKAGKPFDPEGYVRWCEGLRHVPNLDWCLIPDVIGGSADENDALLRDWPAHLRAIGVPVYHLHEDLGRLDRLLNEWPRVALGSSGAFDPPGAMLWWSRMEHVMDVACDEDGRPRARLHGLRMLSPQITARLPLASADSTAAAQNSGMVRRFGTYVSPNRVQRAEVVASILEATIVPARWHRGGTGDLFAAPPEAEGAPDGTPEDAR